MDIDELIAHLQEIKAKHGGSIEVYCGEFNGTYHLFNVCVIDELINPAVLLEY